MILREDTFNTVENKPLRHGGWVKGEIFMSEDFNDPLDFISENETQTLENIRNNNNPETKLRKEAV